DEIYANCDYITLHVPLTPDTKEMINAESIAKMQDHVRILNFARGDLVNSADILKALADGKVASYVTDFPTDEMLGAEGVIAVPHLGASTPESEDNCARMAADVQGLSRKRQYPALGKLAERLHAARSGVHPRLHHPPQCPQYDQPVGR
ncbi:MAG: NAD(P)-dependent oxidoreductase, partial [Anaeromassilibacillus sp.]